MAASTASRTCNGAAAATLLTAALLASAAASAAAAATPTVQLLQPSGQQQASAYKSLPEPPPEQPGDKEKAHAAMNAWLDKFAKEQAERPRRMEDLAPRGANASSLLERLIGKQDAGGGCGVDESKLPVPRDNLVVLPAGEEFDATKWMNRPELANWDLVIIYYGMKPFSCPLCQAVYTAAGPKWRLAWRFTLLPEWDAYRQRYKAILLPDDDLVMDTCAVNRMFSVLQAYQLLMAQPSLCHATWSTTPWRMLYQQNQNILRFTTFIEIMAPVFNMSYFDSFIRPSLYNAWVGWGLDFVWPFLLRYPRDKIGVIDEICIYHPPSNPRRGASVYAAPAPYRQKEEEARRFAEFGYFDSAIAARGYWFQAVETLGAVPKPVRPESMLETSNKVLSTKLGVLYPLLLIGQALLIAVGCLAVACLKLRHCSMGRRPLKDGSMA